MLTLPQAGLVGMEGSKVGLGGASTCRQDILSVRNTQPRQHAPRTEQLRLPTLGKGDARSVSPGSAGSEVEALPFWLATILLGPEVGSEELLAADEPASGAFSAGCADEDAAAGAGRDAA